MYGPRITVECGESCVHVMKNEKVHISKHSVEYYQSKPDAAAVSWK